MGLGAPPCVSTPSTGARGCRPRALLSPPPALGHLPPMQPAPPRSQGAWGGAEPRLHPTSSPRTLGTPEFLLATHSAVPDGLTDGQRLSRGASTLGLAAAGRQTDPGIERRVGAYLLQAGDPGQGLSRAGAGPRAGRAASWCGLSPQPAAQHWLGGCGPANSPRPGPARPAHRAAAPPRPAPSRPVPSRPAPPRSAPPGPLSKSTGSPGGQ